MKGKNKISWKIWIIIILGVLALAGVSYLIYDHFINMDAVLEENKPGDNLEGKIYSLDEFLSLLDGYWDNLDRPGENIIVKFDDGRFILGYYASEADIIGSIENFSYVDGIYQFMVGENIVTIVLKEIDQDIIYVQVNDYEYQKYGFVSNDEDEVVDYFLHGIC